jgi:hypothetical protein
MNSISTYLVPPRAVALIITATPERLGLFLSREITNAKAAVVPAKRARAGTTAAYAARDPGFALRAPRDDFYVRAGADEKVTSAG